MVKRKACKSPVSSHDLAKVKFRPGKFIIVNTTKTYPLKDINLEMASTSKLPENPTSESVDNTPADRVNTNPEIIEIDEENSNPTKDTQWKIMNTGQKPRSLKMLLTKYSVPLNNTFEVLAENSSTNMETNENQPQATKTPEQAVNGKIKRRPPPIVLHSKVAKHKEFCKEIDNEIKQGYHIKYTKHNTNIFIHDVNEYKKYLEQMDKDEIDYHTYSLKTEKHHSFIIRGLDKTVESDDVKTALVEKLGEKIINVFKMKNTNGLFMVVTQSSLKVHQLNNIMRYVCHTRVTWERQIKKNRIVQCHRCQQWGHATSNCRCTPKCVKCAGDHWSRECVSVNKEDPTTAVHIKCANCNGNHLAMSKECPVYLNKLDSFEKQRDDDMNKQARRQPPPNKFIPASVPENAWHKKRAPPSSLLRSYAAQPSTSTEKPTMANNNTGNDFNQLVSEFNVLNSLIDINHMIFLVRSLNSTLKTCTDDMGKFIAFKNFCQTNFGTGKTLTAPCYP